MFTFVFPTNAQLPFFMRKEESYDSEMRVQLDAVQHNRAVFDIKLCADLRRVRVKGGQRCRYWTPDKRMIRGHPVPEIEIASGLEKNQRSHP